MPTDKALGSLCSSSSSPGSGLALHSGKPQMGPASFSLNWKVFP